MHRKIFFNNKPLFLVDQVTKDLEDYLHHDDTVFIDEFNIHTVKAMIHEMELPKIHAGIFLHNDVEALLKAFKKKLTLVLAGGGLVHTKEHDLLLIFRRGKWDLPKGKLDPGEKPEAGALREIKEETGLQRLRSEGPLCVTYHTYHEYGKHILKESHWFSVRSEKQEAFIPQVDEDIELCKWVAIDQLASYLENMHASLIDVVHAGIKILRETKNV